MLSQENHAIALVDYQPAMYQGVQSHDRPVTFNNVQVLAKAAKLFGVPTIVTAVAQDTFSGPFMPEVSSLFPGHTVIDRTSMNAWLDAKFREAVYSTGRKKIAVAGLWTEACVMFVGLELLKEGFQDIVPADPSGAVVAITDGKFSAVGHDHDVMNLAGERTRIIDLKGRRVLPGLIDNHLHIIRGGLNFNMELRWDGVRSLADAMAMLKRQVAITPPPQWVRVVGGFTAHQFAEKRLPTIAELNAAAPDTPVFLLHLYDPALLNAAALRVIGYTRDTPRPPAGEIVRDAHGNPTGLLIAKPNANILYATLARGPKLPFDYQLNSTRHFMRELNRLGVTGAIDAGGGFQNYPEDYAGVGKPAPDGPPTIRLAYNLFTQKPHGEKDGFLPCTRSPKYHQ